MELMTLIAHWEGLARWHKQGAECSAWHVVGSPVNDSRDEGAASTCTSVTSLFLSRPVDTCEASSACRPLADAGGTEELRHGAGSWGGPSLTGETV